MKHSPLQEFKNYLATAIEPIMAGSRRKRIIR